MYRLFFIITSFVYVSCDNWGLIHFSRNSEDLAQCIKDHDSIKALRSDENFKNAEMDAFIGFSAEAFARQTKTLEDITPGVTSSINSMMNFIVVRYIRDPAFRTQLEAAISKALENCQDDDIESDSDNEINSHVNLPHFVYERNGIGTLLNYALANWCVSPQNMIMNLDSRALLRQYAENALNVLMDTYAQSSQMFFHNLLRNIWIPRARLFFDDRDSELPYIDHIVTTDNMTPHTYGGTQRFIIRRTVNYNLRNRAATQDEQNRILNIHRPGNTGSDIYADYARNGMTSADYYFEDHVNQLYRIILFFLEMQLHGISPDATDIPEWIREILSDDNAYRQYLTNRRNQLIDGEDNVYRRNLRRNARVSEVDLIILLRMRLESGVDAMTTTTTAKYTVSSTPKYEDRNSRKGIRHSISKWAYKCSQKLKNSFNDEYFGYITGFPDSAFDEGEATIFMEVLRNSVIFF